MVTLHSLLKLPVRWQNCCELNDQVLAELQYKMHGVKYIWIDEFSVIGQKMSGWVDRKLHQASGKFNLQLGGCSIILVGDSAQLPPVLVHCIIPYQKIPLI